MMVFGALGDRCVKEPPEGSKKRKRATFLEAKPHLQRLEETDVRRVTKFIVLCSDGVYDVLGGYEMVVATVAAHVAGGGAQEKAADALLEAALSRASFLSGMTVGDIRALPTSGGSGPTRRDIIDDMTAVVVFL